MSLINEALKRARHDAAQRKAEASGLPRAAPPAQLFGRRGRRSPLVAGAAVLAVIALGGAFYLAGQRAARRDAGEVGEVRLAELSAQRPPQRSAEEPAGSATGPEAGAGSGGETAATGPPNPAAEPPAADAPRSEAARDPAPDPAGAPDAGVERRRAEPAGRSAAEPATGRRGTAPPTAETGTRSPSPASGPSAAARSAASSGPPPAVPEPATVPSRSTPAGAAAEAGRAATGVAPISDPSSGVILVLPEQDRARPAAAGAPAQAGGDERGGTASYIQRFTTPDGGTIELGGIAWSETGPFALINGQVLGAGSTVHGFVIERIHPRQVELRGSGATVFLTLQ